MCQVSNFLGHLGVSSATQVSLVKEIRNNSNEAILERAGVKPELPVMLASLCKKHVHSVKCGMPLDSLKYQIT